MSIPGSDEYRGLPRRFRQTEHGRSDGGPIQPPYTPHEEQAATEAMAQRQKQQSLNDPTCLVVLERVVASQAWTDTDLAEPTTGFAQQQDLSELADAVRRLLRHRPDLARPLTGSEYPFL